MVSKETLHIKLRQVLGPLVPGLDAADRWSLLGAVDHLAPLAPVVDPGWHWPMNKPCAGLTNSLKIYGSNIVVFWKYIVLCFLWSLTRVARLFVLRVISGNAWFPQFPVTDVFDAFYAKEIFFSFVVQCIRFMLSLVLIEMKYWT